MLLLVGGSAALLEGTAQALARTGSPVHVAQSLSDADELRIQHRPVLVVAERTLLASAAPTDPFLRGLLATGVALVTYRESPDPSGQALVPGLARLVLADLELPLERHRLASLAEHALNRARRVGTTSKDPHRETPAP